VILSARLRRSRADGRPAGECAALDIDAARPGRRYTRKARDRGARHADCKQAMPLRIIATGGTLDKRYDPLTGGLVFGETHLHEVVARARIAGAVEIDAPMLIDSLDMRDEHRLAILEACRACAERRIVVVHGTDTMVETARVIGEAGLDKTVVLTGAMVPYDVEGSDALFNLGFAIGCANALPHGTWVAMNAVAFPWHNVRKNREKGAFEPL